jgi:hypothetical protein
MYVHVYKRKDTKIYFLPAPFHHEVIAKKLRKGAEKKCFYDYQSVCFHDLFTLWTKASLASPYRSGTQHKNLGGGEEGTGAFHNSFGDGRGSY